MWKAALLFVVIGLFLTGCSTGSGPGSGSVDVENGILNNVDSLVKLDKDIIRNQKLDEKRIDAICVYLKKLDCPVK